MKKLFFIGVTLFCISCKTKKSSIVINEATLQIDCIENLNEVIVYDIYSPPVASRIYAYCNLAYYEAFRCGEKDALSFLPKLKFFDTLQQPTQKINYNLSAVIAFFNTAKALCFSKDSVTVKLQTYLNYYKQNLDDSSYNHSTNFGNIVSETILKRAANDNYKYIKSLPKYTVIKQKNIWEQTPPDYMDAVEPNWFLLKPILIDSSNFICSAPPAYSENKNSSYYKEVIEVFEVAKKKTSKMDSLAKYWDDNPFVTEHKGHFMAATKKINPAGHWLGITANICKQKNSNAITISKAFALTSCAMFDGFIACWFQKYKTKMPRPITVIRKWFNPNWNSFLQTPPFPEYTSGHSVISKASATVLSNIFGNNISFTDSTELKYLGLIKKFPSIDSAANQAGISRLYGGIHFRSAIENGKQQGKQIGELYYLLYTK